MVSRARPAGGTNQHHATDRRRLPQAITTRPPTQLTSFRPRHLRIICDPLLPYQPHNARSGAAPKAMRTGRDWRPNGGYERVRYESPVTFRHKVVAAELQTGTLVGGEGSGARTRLSVWCGGSRHWHRGGVNGGHRTGKRSRDRSRHRLALQRSACRIAAVDTDARGQKLWHVFGTASRHQPLSADASRIPRR